MVLTTKKSYFSYSKHKIVGFLDSDASFTLRLLKRQKGGRVGYSLTIAFSQKADNSEILQQLQKQLGSTAKILTSVTGKYKTGEDKKLGVLNITWTRPGG